MREKDFGLWKDISWRHYGRMAKYVGLALLELGLEKGTAPPSSATTFPSGFTATWGSSAWAA